MAMRRRCAVIAAKGRTKAVGLCKALKYNDLASLLFVLAWCRFALFGLVLRYQGLSIACLAL
jgi:hypothetical protein